MSLAKDLWMTKITLRGLKKISLNEWYAGNHWTKRAKIKKDYTWIIKSQCLDVLPKTGRYEIDYVFYFERSPLDASNTIAMVKMIEDVLFEDDKWDVVRKISIISNKDGDERVEIKITNL